MLKPKTMLVTFTCRRQPIPDLRIVKQPNTILCYRAAVASKRLRYGRYWDDRWSDSAIELYCFNEWLTEEDGGLGREQHFINALKLLWPKLEWNDWLDWQVRQFCAPENWIIDGSSKFLNINCTGCATSSKTFTWSLIALTWWLAGPFESRVAICSIQHQMIRSRVWPVIIGHMNQLPGKIGHLIDSKTTIQATRGDDKHSIFGQAVATGETAKAVQKLAGIHPRRYMIVVDEAPGTPEAVFESVGNASKACAEFILVTLGNATSRMDPHGRICEPVDGWMSINQDTGQWRTRGVREWAIKPGVCLHFHGKRSPNVRRGKTIFSYLYSFENWKDAKGREDTLDYWKMDAGFWPPEGISNTIFDEATVEKVGAKDTVLFRSMKDKLGAMDPAYGGDEPVLRFANLGDMEDGKRVLQCVEKVPLRLSEEDRLPVDYQLARQAIEACKARGVKPECFALDITGRGAAIRSIMVEEWSPLVVGVEFGGAPSSTPVSADDGTLCKDAYDRRVTELWYNARELLLASQLKGLDVETVRQFCSRTYGYKGQGRKKCVEPKEECKLRLGRSPDDADTVAILVELARQRGLSPSRGIIGVLAKSRMAKAIEVNEVYDDPDSESIEFKDPLANILAWMEEEA